MLIRNFFYSSFFHETIASHPYSQNENESVTKKRKITTASNVITSMCPVLEISSQTTEEK